MRADRAWKLHGKNNPYFGVLSDRRFLDDELSADHRRAFFASGAEYVRELIRVIEQNTGTTFGPARAVDFGCGVGRLVIPLSPFCGNIVGVDVAEGMLSEAAKNCKDIGITNAEFVLSDDRLSRLLGQFDFIHSFIAIQHVPVSSGMQIIDGLVERLAPDGIAALHMTYASSSSWLWNLGFRARRYRPIGAIANALRGMPLAMPHPEMNSYPLDRVFQVIQKRGIRTISCSLTDHGGFLGALLIFQNRTEKLAF
jgi:SAM-dependent methyltransferase